MERDTENTFCPDETFGAVLNYYFSKGQGLRFSSEPHRTDWTNDFLAGEVNVDPRTISRWRNDNSTITTSNMKSLMEVLFRRELFESEAVTSRFRAARLVTNAMVKAKRPIKPVTVAVNPIDQDIDTIQRASNKLSFSNELQSWLNRLVSMQYPWGEWADERTVWEGVAAERRPRKNAEGPKPNVARTLFALDILSKTDVFTEDYYQIAPLSMTWLKKCIAGGWFEEWKAIGYTDSDHIYPSIKLERDIRHSAQSATMLLRWGGERDYPIIVQIIENLLSSQLSSHFWPESPQKSEKMILATIYALETVALVLVDIEQAEFRNHIGKERLSLLKKSFDLGLTALQEEAHLGDGLLGRSFSGANSYTTGLALFRLARLSDSHRQMGHFVEILTMGLLKAKNSNGWSNETAPPVYAKQSIPRTTLRVLAGLSKIPHIKEMDIYPHIRKLTESYASGAEKMDAPDIACLVEAAVNLNGDDIILHSSFDIVEKYKFSNLLKWTDKFQSYLDQCESAREQNQTADFDNIIVELKEKLSLIDSDKKLLSLKHKSYLSA